MKRIHLEDLWPAYGLIEARKRLENESFEREFRYMTKEIPLKEYNHEWLKDTVYLGALWVYNIVTGVAIAGGIFGLIKILKE